MNGTLRASLWLALWAGPLCLFTGACQQLVGTKDRTLDPSLEPDAATASPACTEYCNTVMANCTDANAQYVSLPVCLADCSHFPLEGPDKNFGNSVQCRQYEATLAGTSGEPDDSCSAAGPDGDPVCGSACDSYCGLIMPICPTAFGSSAECLHDCKSMVDLGSYNTSDQRGDTLQCRIFHVSAATQSPSSHCPHAGAESTRYCVDADAGQEASSTCTPDPGADDCDLCEAKNCCPEKSACYADTICDTADGDFDTCVDVAESIDAGTAACHARFVATNSFASALESCKRDHCASECDIPALAQ
jgi:hypothetical protein